MNIWVPILNLYKFLQLHTEVCGWPKKVTWLNLETIILLWGEANIFKLFKKTNLQLSLFCLEYRTEALKTSNLRYKGSNTSCVCSFKHLFYKKSICRLFKLILERLFIFSSSRCSKRQEFWNWFPRKTNSNLILVQLQDKLRLTFPCVWGGRPKFPLWNLVGGGGRILPSSYSVFARKSLKNLSDATLS